MRKVNYSNCTNLHQIAQTTLIGLEEVYDHAYVEYLRRMPYYLKNCQSYRELGTNQGGSSSVAVLMNLEYYELIDKSFSNFNPIKHIFEKYCLENNIKVTYHEKSSLEVQTDKVTDFLLVDSVHRYKHVTKELDIYSPLTKKYIMFHDTYGIPEVAAAVERFLSTTDDWKEVERHSESAGFIVIEKINQ